MKLKVFVNLQEKIEDPNLDLVVRGFFPTQINLGGFKSSEDNVMVKTALVQTVVAFDMVTKPDDGQRAFLRHLKGEVVERVTLHDDADQFIEEY